MTLWTFRLVFENQGCISYHVLVAGDDGPVVRIVGQPVNLGWQAFNSRQGGCSTRRRAERRLN